VPDRRRKLLLHRRELDRLQKATQRDGLFIVPLKLYFKGGRVKILIGIGRSKNQRDKRADVKDRDAKRMIARVLKRGG
jgi:SsrA-binding protein